jgi:hypothetical protein
VKPQNTPLIASIDEAFVEVSVAVVESEESLLNLKTDGIST